MAASATSAAAAVATLKRARRRAQFAGRRLSNKGLRSAARDFTANWLKGA
jgi:hypothetical protein